MVNTSTVPHISKELKDRIVFTVLSLVVYRLGTYLPLPGIDAGVLKEFTSNNQSGILGMLNMFSGGALGRMTIFALNVIPFITASIIFQLLTTASERLSEIKKSGEQGRVRINQYTRYLAVIICVFQSYGIASSLENISYASGDLVTFPGLVFRATTVFSIVASTLFLVWLGDQITARGIGNGISLIIFAGIVAELPSALVSTIQLGRTGSISTLFILFIMVLVVGLIVMIIFFERSFRKISVRYPKQNTGMQYHNPESSHLPLKLNTAGVIPPIFASSILLFPITLISFGDSTKFGVIENFVLNHLAHGKPLYILFYGALIMFFCFFYTAVVFNTKETADHLKKAGGFVPGVRPGEQTAVFLDNILGKITLIGCLYLLFVCVVPEIILAKYSLPFYLGGTSLLIVVNVSVDTLSQIQTHMISGQYQGKPRKNRVRIRR